MPADVEEVTVIDTDSADDVRHAPGDTGAKGISREAVTLAQLITCLFHDKIKMIRIMN